MLWAVVKHQHLVAWLIFASVIAAQNFCSAGGFKRRCARPWWSFHWRHEKPTTPCPINHTISCNIHQYPNMSFYKHLRSVWLVYILYFQFVDFIVTLFWVNNIFFPNMLYIFMIVFYSAGRKVWTKIRYTMLQQQCRPHRQPTVWSNWVCCWSCGWIRKKHGFQKQGSQVLMHNEMWFQGRSENPENIRCHVQAEYLQKHQIVSWMQEIRWIFCSVEMGEFTDIDVQSGGLSIACGIRNCFCTNVQMWGRTTKTGAFKFWFFQIVFSDFFQLIC